MYRKNPLPKNNTRNDDRSSNGCRPGGEQTEKNVPVKTLTPNTRKGNTMVTEIVTDSSGRTTKINVPLKVSTPVNTESTTRNDDEIVTDSSGRTTKINVP
ncbi:hypothetical protein TNIN_333731 [Trichonephila inaurata madagascariensis]|uniref:Uncharacterized protein n=1 Tax=Trichonephila inaurata madagascariensis TaxID=2747483 RepID=A0A8X6IZN1_9ARAC|nr:hypothetical protein TNIN_333731 [Trichonephila inaurata madagascariensis]